MNVIPYDDRDWFDLSWKARTANQYRGNLLDNPQLTDPFETMNCSHPVTISRTPQADRSCRFRTEVLRESIPGLSRPVADSGRMRALTAWLTDNAINKSIRTID